MNRNIVLVSGGRDYKKKSVVFAVLDTINSLHPISKIVQGGANGADRLAKKWAKARKIPCKTYYAEWKKYGRSAGSKRNMQMAKQAKPNLAVIFPGGVGTKHMLGVVKFMSIRNIIIG